MLRKVTPAVALSALLLAACSNAADGGGGGQETATGPDQAGDEALVDPIVAEGNGLGSCAFEFSVETLAERQFAFEGTVAEIREPAAMDAPYEIVFQVAQWFNGGDASTTSVRTYDVSGTSLAGDLGLAVGDRVLASGDEDFLWGCGFSMPYSDSNAALFAEAFAT